MSNSIAVRHRPHSASGARALRWAQRIAIAVGGMIIGALLFAVLESAIGIVHAAIPEDAATAEAFVPNRPLELEPEWRRWDQPGVQYEQAWREQQSPRRDWIRKGSGR